MHLEIILPTDRTERTASSVVSKLYSLAYEDPISGSLLDNTSNIVGSIGVPAAYDSHIQYLTTKYQDLHISADSIYIMFLDPEVERVLIAGGFSTDGIGVTTQDATSATFTSNTFLGNTTITSFNEFDQFTRANSNPPLYLFKNCTNLTNIDLSATTVVSNYEFLGTGITDVNAPNLSSASKSGFSDCLSLTTVTNLGHLTLVPESLFYGSRNIQTINLPDECLLLLYNAFSAGNTYSSAITTVNGINHIKVFGQNCFYGAKQLLLSALDIAAAELIGNGAFWYVKVASINCPNLLTLNTSAFRENGVLTTIDCLGKISSIGNSCFLQDTSLLSVKIPYECTTIGSSAFSGCTLLSSVKLYNKSLDNYADGESPIYNSLSRVNTFNNSCFYGCSSLSLTNNDISSATVIGNDAFYNTRFTGDPLNLTNITTIGKGAFRLTDITSVVYSSTMSKIDELCFSNCTNLTSITAPQPITRIEYRGFYYCGNLETIFDLSNVTYIGGEAFAIGGIGADLQMKLKLNQVVNLPNVTESHYCAFGGCNFKHLYMPKLPQTSPLTYFRNGQTCRCAFSGIEWRKFYCDLIYFKDLLKIYSGAFCLVAGYALVINNTTPPTWANLNDISDDQVKNPELSKERMFLYCNFSTRTYNNNWTIDPSTIHVYVPNSAVTAYLNHPLWGTYCTILPISDLNSGVIYATEADWTTAGKPVGLIAEYLGLSTADLATFVSANNLTYYTVPSN